MLSSIMATTVAIGGTVLGLLRRTQAPTRQGRKWLPILTVKIWRGNHRQIMSELLMATATTTPAIMMIGILYAIAVVMPVRTPPVPLSTLLSRALSTDAPLW